MVKRTSLVRLDQEREVINLLKTTPMSIQALSDSSNFNYYTIRNIVNDLYERKVVRVQTTVDRHRIYMFNAEEQEEHDHIPRVTDLLDQTSIKVTSLLELVGSEGSSKATVASMQLARYVTELLMAAHYARHGQEVTHRLETTRAEMQRSYLYLQNTANLMDQMLHEPRFWEPRYLVEMTKDPSFNYQEIQKAQDYYDNA